MAQRRCVLFEAASIAPLYASPTGDWGAPSQRIPLGMIFFDCATTGGEVILERQFNNNCFILVASAPRQEKMGAHVLLSGGGDCRDARLLDFVAASPC